MVVLNLVLNLILIQFLAHVGVALATCIAAWVNAGALAFLLHRHGAWYPDRRLRSRVPRMLLAAGVMMLVLWGLSALLFPAEGLRVARLLLLVATGMATYFGTAHLLGALDLRDLRNLRRRKSSAAAVA